MMLPHELRRRLNELQRGLKRANGMAQTLFYAREGTVVDKVLAAASIAGEVIDVLMPKQSAHDDLVKLGYVKVGTGIGAFLCDLLRDSTAPVEVVIHSDGDGVLGEEERIFFWSHPDLPERCVAAIYQGSSYEDGPYVLSAAGLSALRSIVRAHAWGGRLDLQISTTRRMSESADASFVLLELEPVQFYVGDPSADWYAQRMVAYQGDHRVIRLVGPTGVGKSTLARILGRSMLGEGAKTLKVSSAATRRMSSSDLFDLADYLSPDVFVIDDFRSGRDQYDSENGHLDFLESLHERIPLTVLTSMLNQPEESSAQRAMGLRPGRIDETFHLQHPTDLVRRILLIRFLQTKGISLKEEQLDDLVSRTVGMTGAYLMELVVRLSKHGVESYRVEVSRFCNEIAEEDGHFNRYRTRALRLRGKPSKAVVNGSVNPKARTQDMRAWISHMGCAKPGTFSKLKRAQLVEIITAELARLAASKGSEETALPLPQDDDATDHGAA